MNKKNEGIALEGALWINVEGVHFGNAKHIALLAHIEEYGSITQAAKAINLSYKAAWDAINNMNKLAKEPLMERISGGKGGGGTILTERGKQLVKNFLMIEEKHRQFIEQLSINSDYLARDLSLIQKMRMTTSARNQLLGKIIAIKEEAINDEITLEISDSFVLTAMITHESCKNLQLTIGMDVFALIKAPNILIKPNALINPQDKNLFTGTVIEILVGKSDTELLIELACGTVITAVVSQDYIKQYLLENGREVTGIIHSRDIILGVL